MTKDKRKEQEALLDHGLTAAYMKGQAQGNDKIKELQEENKKLKEEIKVEADKIYNITKDNKYDYHASELDGGDEEEIFNSSKLILNILNNENN